MQKEQGQTRSGVAYTVRGTGPPLLWMSGYLVPVVAFESVIDELSGFTVVAMDHRGSGASRTRALPTTTGTMAHDALSVLDHLGVGAAHVVGSSLGGMVAQEIAIGWPHRVRTLVLCSTTAGGPGAKTPPWRDVAAELNQTARRVPGHLGLRIMGALHQTAAASSHDATRRVHRILAPTLVVHGDEDELVPIGNASWLAEGIPSAQLEVVRGGSHLLVLESLAARAVVKAWLDEHSDQPPAAPRSSRERLAYLAETPCRAFLGQTLPLRRVIRIGMRMRLVSRGRRQRDGGVEESPIQ